MIRIGSGRRADRPLESVPVHEQFGRYILLERIAIGGMAEIFRAKAPGLGGFEKILAIKRLHPRYSQDADFIEMLIDEARITVELSHSNIGQIFDLGKVDDHYYIAMEFIDGRDLYRVLKRLRDRRMQMPVDAAAYVAMEACAGLDYAHRKKDGKGRPLHIVHRDVSPQNVLLAFEGEVKIVDFGIAKAALRAYETEAGIIKGKFYYMSPEQARGEPLDHRTDIFSIGIVLYEMLTGELLYKDDDEVSLLSRVRRAEIAPPSTVRPDVPPALDRIVMRALTRERGDRYPSAQHMQRELARFLRGAEVPFNKVRLAQLMHELFNGDSPVLDPTVDDAMRDRRDMPPDARSVIGRAAVPGDGMFDDGDDRTSLEPGLDSAPMLTGDDLLMLGTGSIELLDEPDTRGDAGPGAASFDDPIQTYGGEIEDYDSEPDLLASIDAEDFFDDEPTRAYEGDRLREGAEAVAAAQGWSPGGPAHAPAAPVQAAPAAPVRAAPVRPAPVRAAPVRAAPVHAAPHAAPVHAAPVHPAQAAPARPVQAAPRAVAPMQGQPPVAPVHGMPAHGPAVARPAPAGSLPPHGQPAPFGAPGAGMQPPFGQGQQRRTRAAPAVGGPGLAPTGAMQSPLPGGPPGPGGAGAPAAPGQAGFNRQRTVIVPADEVGQGPRTDKPRRRSRRPGPAPTIAASPETRPWLDRERMIIGAILLLVVVGTGIATTLLIERQGTDDTPTVIETAARPEAPETPEATPPPPAPPPAPTTATLVIRIEPEDAQVQIDGKWVVHDAPSARYEVKAGEAVAVKVQAPGYAPFETELNLEAGVNHPLDVRLDRLTGTLIIETRPSAATIFVAGKERGASPLTLENVPLDRPTPLRVEKAGYQPLTREVEWSVDGQRERTLELALEAKPTPKPKRRTRRTRARSRARSSGGGGGGTGFVSVTSRQWGSVFLNRGQIAMETPLIKYKVPVGRHRVHVCYAGDRSRCTPSKTVTIRKGETSVVKF